MRNKFFIQILIVLFSIGACIDAYSASRNDGKAPFAVVELFTSEGCSSCPAMDEYLKDLTEYSRLNHFRVFTLSFHVDYWNRLGWTDRFSDRVYTAIQREYSVAHKSKSIYTPQILVNGEDVFKRRYRANIGDFLDKQLALPAKVIVDLPKISLSERVLKVDYYVQKSQKSDILNIAIVERGHVSKVTAGENRGLTLHHENVVRGYQTLSLDNPQGTATLTLPEDLDLSKSTVIGYVQDVNSRIIRGANFKDLKSI